MANKRKLEVEVTPHEMVNRRVDEELKEYDKAFEALAALMDQEKKDNADDAKRPAAA
jgi:hypothetical protein